MEEEYSFDTHKAKKVKISWAGAHIHVDDKITKELESAELNIEVKE